ncbi:hypothetical protein HYU20_01130 [Candidatus Woesearchaeota archaeon]|nr:hypothetical protein [Candidatus Woesearchaeota archaeon]
MVAAMVVGILSVVAAHSKTITVTPTYSITSSNQTYNFTVTLGAGSATINEIRITKPASYSAIFCLGANPVGGWSCSANGTPASLSYVEFTGGTLAAGAVISINITSTSPAGGGNHTFAVRTQGDGEAANTTNINVTVDSDQPYVRLMNVSDGTNVLSPEATNGLFFLGNTTTGLRFVINATDNLSGIASVTLYYNFSNTTAPGNNLVAIPDFRGTNGSNVSSSLATNASYGVSNMYNVTLNDFTLRNGSRIAFTIVAYDTARNFNESNSSNASHVSSYAYNFTIDSVAPQFADVQIANGSHNQSQLSTNAINITSVLTSKVEYIINSSVLLNLTALVRDDGGSGTIKVEVMNRSGAFMEMTLLTGANASSTQTSWVLNGSGAGSNITGGNYNISQLVKSFAGDGLYNITFRATDNVSNQNATYNFTVEVDDTPPTLSVTTNITIPLSADLLSVGNATISNTSINNTAFVIRVITVGNLNNNTANISVAGNLGDRYNFTYESGTPSGTSIWNLTVKAASAVNITNFCTFGSTASTFGPDASTCNLKFNISDVMGRINNSVNLTIAVDGLAPNVSVLSPVSLTTNYTGTALINVSVNDTVGPMQNVSFRIVNRNNFSGIAPTTEGAYNGTSVNFTIANVTNWIPMTLGTGSNAQFLTNGTWQYTINLTALNFSDGNYTIEINATDSAGRQNTSVNATDLVFDSTPPQNITLITAATNSFHRVNFTVNINATEQASGLKNVTVRLENGTHNSPWVGVQQAFPSALSSITAAGVTARFNATAFNITHIGLAQENISLNATNGNFTLRLNVTDTAGNQNTSITINFTIDTVVPFGIRFDFPASQRNQSTNFTINVSVLNESNVNTVQFRWENGTYVDGTSVSANVSDWINMNSYEAGNNTHWNATFNMTEGAPVDGNFTIAINVTDKAGNSNTSALGNANNSAFIQLLFDRGRPEVVYVGSLSSSQQTDDFVVNMTTKDNRSFSPNAPGVFNISNINATAFRLENSTFNGSYQNITFATTDLGNVGNANRTNVTFEFTSVANGNYNIRFWVNDTAGNQNTSVVVSNITLDNVAAGVAFSETNVSPAPSGGAGSSGTITFNATVTDNLPLNISVTNWSQAENAAYGVFYRLENSTLNGSWIPMNTTNFQNQVHNNTGSGHKATFSASNNTAAVADGDYRIRINVTDKANNQNTTQTISVTIQNGGSKVRALNLTFQGGIFNGFANSSTDSYTFLVNTSANATCRYSLDTAITYYDDMTSTMSNNVSRAHSISFGPFRDVAASGHTLHYACKDVSGNFTALDGASSQFPFGVDTRNRYNVTVPGKTDNKWPNYFQAASAGAANGWSSFTLSTLALSDTTLNSTTGGYNVTNVLSSLLQGTAAGNFTRIYAYNASTDTFQSFRVGQTGNSFINFSDESEYWINVTQIERIEVR